MSASGTAHGAPEPVVIRETECKSFINRLQENLFTIRVYSIRLSGNPYGGCAWDCSYCYAPFVYRFTPGVTPRDFGHVILARMNAPKVLRRELERGLASGKLRREYLDLGTVTDAYQPAERRYRLTRQILETCLELNFPVTVLTKSPFVLDDLDLWRELARKGIGVVGMSLTRPTSVPPDFKQLLEPASAGSRHILDALSRLQGEGVPTFVFADPVVPYMTAREDLVADLLREIAATGTQHVFFGVMKLSPLTWGLFKDRLQSQAPDQLRQIEELYIRRGTKEFGRSWVPPFEYRRNLYTYASHIARELGLVWSCEGGFYDLWTGDWAEVEDQYRHPTGYNLWAFLHERRSPVTFAQMKSELGGAFPTVGDSYFEALEPIWASGKLFTEQQDVTFEQDGGLGCYAWLGSEAPSPAGENQG